jgi:hypothetical protein
MRERVDNRPVARRWPARIATTLAAWLVAFLIVTALLSLLGDELASLPLALRALVMSGVLMTVMTTVVMPALSVAVGRWLPDPPRTGSPGVAQQTQSAVNAVPELSNDRELTRPRTRTPASLRSDTSASRRKDGPSDRRLG